MDHKSNEAEQEGHHVSFEKGSVFFFVFVLKTNSLKPG